MRFELQFPTLQNQINLTLIQTGGLFWLYVFIIQSPSLVSSISITCKATFPLSVHYHINKSFPHRRCCSLVKETPTWTLSPPLFSQNSPLPPSHFHDPFQHNRHHLALLTFTFPPLELRINLKLPPIHQVKQSPQLQIPKVHH